jgi:transglutaminase-like putative cysteine protease
MAGTSYATRPGETGPAGRSERSPAVPTGRRRRRPVVVRWPLSLMLLVLLLSASTALGPLLAGSSWWWVLLVLATGVFASAAGMRRSRIPPVLVPFLTTGVLAMLLTLLFGGGTGLFWLLPTGDTVASFADQARAGVVSIQTQDTPAEVGGGILFLLAVGVGVLAILMDTLAIGLRLPALAGIPALVPLAVPGIVIPEGAEWTALVASAVAYLLLLRVDVHLRPAPAAGRDARAGQGGGTAIRGTLAIGALGIVSALVLSANVPQFGTAAGNDGPNSALFGGGVTPLIDLGQDLRRPRPGPALHYRTTATEQPYLAMLTLDDIRGTTWLPRTVPVDSENTVDAIDNPPGLSDDVARTPATTIIGIDGVTTDLLPVPVPATSVAGLSGDWFWNNGTRAISSPDSTTVGQRYSVTSLEVQPTREQLRQSDGRYPATIEASLGLPDGAPPIIEDTARSVTAGAESTYDAAVALQGYLRSNEFSYDTESPVEDGYDGGGADVIGTFLEEKRGYCVHFASAMAMMARSLDIPSRVTLGYLPGTRTTTVVDGLNRYNVSSHDLHSWPELYFVGVGWVPFEPTPGRGSVPDYALPESSAAPGQPTSAAAPSAAPQQNPADGLAPGALDVGSAPRDDASDTLARIALVAAGLTVLLLTPGVWRALRRRRRRTLLADGRADASLAWQELADSAVDHGVSVSDTMTARELAAALRERGGVADTPRALDALERLLVATERARYARTPETRAPGDPHSADDLDTVITAIRHGSDRVTRVRAVLAPASLSSPVLRRMGLTREAREGMESPRDDRTPTGA